MWSAVPGASTYHVFLAASPTVTPTNYLSLPEGRHVPGVPRTTCDIAGLSDGGTYWVTVFVTDKRVFVLEAGGGNDAFARARPSVERAIQSFQAG